MNDDKEKKFSKPKEEAPPKPKEDSGASGNPGANGGSESSDRFNSKLINAAAKVNFFTRLGMNLNRMGMAVPGICVLRYMPTWGKATSADDAINVAMGKIYRDIRHANSGARNYAPSDLFIADMCVESLISWYMELVRLSGLLLQISPWNAYLGKRLVTDLGYDFDDLNEEEGINSFLSHIISLGTKLNGLALIPEVQGHKDHLDLSARMYMDGDSIKAQIYAFQQESYYSYEVVDQVKGVTTISPYDEGLMKLSDIKRFTSRLYNALMQSEDIFLMMGDIKKCYGDRANMNVPVVGDPATVEFKKSDDILAAISNATIVPTPTFRYKDQQGIIVQESSIESNKIPSLDGNWSGLSQFVQGIGAADADNADLWIQNTLNRWLAEELIVNTVLWEPTPADVARLTRFMVDKSYAATIVDNAGHINLNAYGLAIITSMRIDVAGTVDLKSMYGLTRSPICGIVCDTAPSDSPWTGGGLTRFEMCDGDQVVYFTYSRGEEQLTQVASQFVALADAILANFDWHPPIHWWSTTASAGEWSGTSTAEPPFLPTRDFENYALISSEQLLNIHEARIFNAFGLDE